MYIRNIKILGTVIIYASHDISYDYHVTHSVSSIEITVSTSLLLMAL